MTSQTLIGPNTMKLSEGSNRNGLLCRRCACVMDYTRRFSLVFNLLILNFPVPHIFLNTPDVELLQQWLMNLPAYWLVCLFGSRVTWPVSENTYAREFNNIDQSRPVKIVSLCLITIDNQNLLTFLNSVVRLYVFYCYIYKPTKSTRLKISSSVHTYKYLRIGIVVFMIDICLKYQLQWPMWCVAM